MKFERLIVGVTYRCQCDCIHCSQGKYRVDPKQELSYTEICEAIETASKYGLKELNLFGGEALLRNDIYDIIKFGKSKAQHVTLDTNGVHITRKIARRLKDSGIDLMYMSLFSADDKMNDELHRRKGIFAEIMSATDVLLAEDIPLYYSTCIFRSHLEIYRLEDMIDLAKQKGINGVRLLYPLSSGKWLTNLDVLLDKSELDRFNDLIDNKFVFVSEGMDDKNWAGCTSVSKGTIFISPYGEVQPCNFVPVYLGSIKEEPLDIIIARAERHEFFTPKYQQGRCPMRSSDFLTILNKGINKDSSLYEIGDFPVIDFNYGCTNGCVVCNNSTNKSNFSAMDQLDKLLDSKLEYESVWLRGGEPLLDKSCFEIIKKIKGHGLSPLFISNGRIFADQKTVAKVLKAGLSEIHVPLWGHNAEEYDLHIRVPNGFKLLVKAIALLSKAGVKCVLYVQQIDEKSLAFLIRAGAKTVIKAKFDDGFYCDNQKDLGKMKLPDSEIIFNKKINKPNAGKNRDKALLSGWTKPVTPKRNTDAAISDKSVLIVVPPLDATKFGFEDFKFDYVSNFPLAALKLASYYKARGSKVQMLDCFNVYNSPTWKPPCDERIIRQAACGNYKQEKISRPIYRVGLTRSQISLALNAMPDDITKILVSSIFTYSFPSTWEVIELLRKRYPSAHIILGGIYPTLCPKHASKSGADEIVVGSVPEISNQWIDIESWKRFSGKTMSLKSSYGCNNRCSYCAVKKLEGRATALELEDFFEQIKFYIKHGLKELHLWDSDILFKRKHFEAILDFFINEKTNIALSVPSGFSLTSYNKKIAAKMLLAGFKDVIIPLETTRADKQEEFHRKHLSKKFKSAIADSLAAGFKHDQIHAVIMYGYPGQTKTDLLDDLAAIIHEGVRISLRVYTPIPNTEDYSKYFEQFSELPLENLDSFLFPLAHKDLTVSFMEDVYKLTNMRVFTENDIFKLKDTHELFAEILERL